MALSLHKIKPAVLELLSLLFQLFEEISLDLCGDVQDFASTFDLDVV